MVDVELEILLPTENKRKCNFCCVVGNTCKWTWSVIGVVVFAIILILAGIGCGMAGTPCFSQF